CGSHNSPVTTSHSADTPTSATPPGNSQPEHCTRFDTEIVLGMDALPPLWTLNDGRRLRRSGEPESVFQDADGGTHTAYAMRRELPSVPGSRDPFKLDSQIWYRPSRGEAELAAHGPTFAPQIVALPGGTILIAFRLDGLKPPPVPPLPPIPPVTGSWPDAGAYLRAREGGGASIGFAFRPQDGTWKRGYVARAEEIIVRDSSEQETFAGRIFPAFETLGPPALGLDCHGVPWCFWANPLRRHTYFARWLGPTHGFSAPLEARGAYYALGESVALEAQMPLDVSHLLGAAVAGGRVHLSPLPVPTPATSEKRHILFLDLLEVAALDGIEHRLGQVEKRSENPLVSAEDIAVTRGAPVRPLGAPKVWRHAPPSEADQAAETAQTSEAGETGVSSLRMELGPRGPMGGPATGFLESRDGLRWTPLPDAGITVDGKLAPAWI
ncbi:MAG TPA: hypothetical protein VNM48_05585, partial [Chloroflexota bacterium]|nr:hypothetical protein [Chloroflexota bacterium]